VDDLHRRGPSTLGQLLGADSIHQALVTTKYQEEVVGADRAAVDRVERLRRQVEALAAKLADQAERQERLQVRLAAKRHQIEARLAASRRYHQRLTRQVRRTVAEERRRQEALRRRALLRRLAAAGRPRPLAASASDAELAADAAAHEAQAAQLRDGALVDAMRRAYLTLEPIRIKAGPGWCCWPNCSPQRRRSWPPRSPPSCAWSA
jgi:hypothetical protein